MAVLHPIEKENAHKNEKSFKKVWRFSRNILPLQTQLSNKASAMLQ